MAPPLDRKDLYGRDWISRQNTYFRLPRRTRRATILCFALLIAAFYFLVDTATQWSGPEGIFTANEPLLPIRFPNLYPTLSHVIGSGGSRKFNRNVIFVAGNLTAASKLAGIACDMAEYRRSNVHLALVGFDSLSLDDFRQWNGLSEVGKEEGCRVTLHDARPEFGERLPLDRQKIALKSAFRHINDFMHPQAVFVDTANEAEWFLEIAKEKVEQMGTALVELDKHAVDDLKWITRLDSGSLHAWHKPSFEVVIHADAHSGNLERLLKSLESAYYPSPEHRPTRVTIVLDPFEPIHPLTRDFLRGYKFPSQSRVSIQRPLLPKNDPQAAARNFLESFYTLSDDHSVLFLDPNTELSKWYPHYLLFTTLEYRYSSYQNPESSRALYGISLEPPLFDISGKTPFPLTDFDGSPFLYPAPSSRTALFFPQHWSELHFYVSHQLSAENLGSRNASATAPSLQLPEALATSWQAPLIELARARGYSMLYPSFKKETFAIVHNEVPSRRSSQKLGGEKRLIEKAFLDLLPESDLPAWDQLPLRDLWGENITATAFEDAAKEYRRSITTCPEDTQRKEFQVGDLFCDKDGRSL